MLYNVMTMALQQSNIDTIILSDIHLSEAGTEDPKRPLWKRFKLPEHFVDEDLEAMLQQAVAQSAGRQIELVLNGDIFDFDSVMNPSLRDVEHDFQVSWLERLRGLAPEEQKSVVKLQTILRDHPVFVRALSQFVAQGGRLIFVIGNHDVELHWPAVQQLLRASLAPGPAIDADQIRFCEWFYISEQDTLIEHGNQYDDYCVALDPIHPTIEVGGRPRIRLPFGNLCSRFMLNGMGLMNPHVDDSFIKSSVWDYIGFFYRKVARTQPLLLWTWFWGACAVLWHALREGFMPARKNPTEFSARVAEIARRANASPEVTLALREVHIHPSVFRPWKIAQELWLDRVIIFAVLFIGSMQFISLVEVFVALHPAWTALIFMLAVPPFIFYMRSVQSKVGQAISGSLHAARLTAKIAKVKRVVHGHTHVESRQWLDEVEYINTGTWSPAFHDAECTQAYGRRCFAWIRSNGSGTRTAGLYAWENSSIAPVDVPENHAPLPIASQPQSA